ncbi:tail fiber assembly protein [Yersinia enterocolitica]|nr:tail fiber assembly protein [Yersinia enterocolitica]
MIYRNFVLYKPENATVSGKYLRSENGEDWYEIRGTLDADAFKIIYNADGVIITGAYDSTGLFPENGSVAEINPDEIPDEFAVDGSWMFDGEKILRREKSSAEKLALAEAEKQFLLNNASIMIGTLQDAVDFGDASDAEKAALELWRKYRVLLMRVDTAAPVWPTPPVA